MEKDQTEEVTEEEGRCEEKGEECGLDLKLGSKTIEQHGCHFITPIMIINF